MHSGFVLNDMWFCVLWFVFGHGPFGNEVSRVLGGGIVPGLPFITLIFLLLFSRPFYDYDEYC